MTEILNIRTEPFAGSALDVYVGRAGRGQTGYYGNPVEIGRPCPECREVHATGGDTLPCYRRYLERRLSSDRLFRRRVAQLHGKRLYCFCAPRPCHAQILAEWAARLAKRYVTVNFRLAGRPHLTDHPDPWAGADDEPSELEILGVVGDR